MESRAGALLTVHPQLAAAGLHDVMAVMAQGQPQPLPPACRSVVAVAVAARL